MSPPPIPPEIEFCQSDGLGREFGAATPRPRGRDSRTQRNHSRAPQRRPRAKLNANWPVAWSATASAQPETAKVADPASRTVPTARPRLERPNAITAIVRCGALGVKNEEHSGRRTPCPDALFVRPIKDETATERACRAAERKMAPEPPGEVHLQGRELRGGRDHRHSLTGRGSCRPMAPAPVRSAPEMPSGRPCCARGPAAPTGPVSPERAQ